MKHKNVKIVLSITSFTALLLFLASCQKKDNTLVDASQVVFSVSSPLSNQVYHKGDTVQILANISYPTELHGYEVKIIDTTTGFIVYDNPTHVHDDHFSVNEQWIDSAAQQQHLKLEVIAVIDHDGDNAIKQINFQYQP
jgi:hypothetical protein